MESSGSIPTMGVGHRNETETNKPRVVTKGRESYLTTGDSTVNQYYVGQFTEEITEYPFHEMLGVIELTLRDYLILWVCVTIV